MPDHDDAQDYTANGPSAFGFRTGGANIAVGAELTGKDTGVHGTGKKIGVFGEGETAGVLGRGTTTAPPGGVIAASGVGVIGESKHAPGVRGHSEMDDGVVGISRMGNKSGVFGFNELRGSGPAGYGVFGRCDTVSGAGVGGHNDGTGEGGAGGPGVKGSSKAGDGVVGEAGAKSKSGVFGFNLRGSGPAFGVAGTVASADGGGILGFTDAGTGVIGNSRNGRGAKFESGRAAQVQLVPHPPAFELPREGQNGDLIALSELRPMAVGDPGLVTELWFCVKGSSRGQAATWGRVHFDLFK